MSLSKRMPVKANMTVESPHTDWLSKLLPRVMLGVLALLILLQGALILFGGMKYLTIPAGYYEPLADHTSDSSHLTTERRGWLEKQLLPASTPIWSKHPPEPAKTGGLVVSPELVKHLPDLRSLDTSTRNANLWRRFYRIS